MVHDKTGNKPANSEPTALHLPVERANLIFAPAKLNIMKIIADQNIPYLRGILEPHARVSYLPSTAISPETVRDADALQVRTRMLCNRFLLQGSRVSFIGSATTGTDPLDDAFLNQDGIHYANAPRGNAISVIQYVLAALFELVLEYQKSIKGKTLNIIGVGTIGSKVSNFARLIPAFMTESATKHGFYFRNVIDINIINGFSVGINFYLLQARIFFKKPILE